MYNGKKTCNLRIIIVSQKTEVPGFDSPPWVYFLVPSTSPIKKSLKHVKYINNVLISRDCSFHLKTSRFMNSIQCYSNSNRKFLRDVLFIVRAGSDIIKADFMYIKRITFPTKMKTGMLLEELK